MVRTYHSSSHFIPQSCHNSHPSHQSPPHPERHGLLEPKQVEALQTKIINSLRDHVTYNPEAQRKPQYFTRILDKLQVLRSLSQQALQRIFYLRLEGLVPEPPIIERMFSSSIPF